MRIILASKSPRRKELLSKRFKDFEVIVSEADESIPAGILPEEGVALIAERKGQAVYRKICCEMGEEYANSSLIISSDTLVEIDGYPLGKPRDKADAYSMIERLSGKAHCVRTGVAVSLGGKSEKGTATTKVYFKKLDHETIENYVSSSEPYDKAGAYGIQGAAGEFVENIEGDYDTVVGLSMALVEKLVEKVTR